MTSSSKKFVEAGKISSPHGIAGQVKVFSYLSSAKNFSIYKDFYDASGEKFPVKYKSSNQTHAIFSIQGVTTRNDAETYRDKMIYILRSDMPQLEDDFSFYFNDLKNLKVRDLEDNEIGFVSDVHDFGAGTIIEIKLDAENNDPKKKSKKQMFILDQDNFPEIDIEEGFVVLNPPEVFAPELDSEELDSESENV